MVLAICVVVGAPVGVVLRPDPSPYGVLGTSSVGPVTVGMDMQDVVTHFGQPDEKETVNFGGGPAPQVDWIWYFSGEEGAFRLQFDTRRDAVTGYVSNTARLATRSRGTIGRSFSPISQRYGDRLKPPPVGSPTEASDVLMLSENEPGTYPALTFFVDNGYIESISGGVFQAAGE